MRGRQNPVDALLALPRLADPAERRAAFRQGVAALGQAVRVTGPPPLDGVEPSELVRAVHVALGSGLCDELDWIAPGPAAVALYELSVALPPGRERRELARRAFTRLYEGTAATFAAVGARVAIGTGRALDQPALRARVELVLDLPIGSTVSSDPLALALVSRRELADRWVVRASTGALPARRTAALLLERASREAAMRAQQGDPAAGRLLRGALHPTFERLLADREPLVWRHAAVARGLLAHADATLADEIAQALDPALTPTEWRRAAVSLVATLASDPEGARKPCRALLEGDLARRDPGLCAAMLWGLPRVIESEPDAAEELLDRLSTLRRADVAGSLARLLSNCASSSFGARAAETLRQALVPRIQHESGADRVAIEEAVSHLERARHDDGSIHAHVRRALAEFEATGARAAHDRATQALELAHRATERIERAADPAQSHGLTTLLADLDESILERPRLASLLLLARRPGDADATVPELERLHERLGRAILDAEERGLLIPRGDEDRQLRGRRLRCLLHLVDVESARGDAEDAGGKLRARLRRALSVLLARLSHGGDPATHRILCATLARSFDAAVREGLADASDVVLLAAQAVVERASFGALCEASTHPDVSAALSAYRAFLDPPRDAEASLHDTETGPRSVGYDDVQPVARRVSLLSERLGADGSYRGEALRQVMLRLGRALEALAAARGLAETVDTSGSGSAPLAELEVAVDQLRQLTAGARRRVLAEEVGGSIAVVADVARLSALYERTVTTGVPPSPQQASMAIGELCADVPEPLALAVTRVLRRLATLPAEPSSEVVVIPLEQRRAELPDWLLPRRALGAFFVVRALGGGGASSVFVARRYEERNDPRAESFALKVPEYDPSTARSLSEHEFLQLFREEAGALLSLPHHANLARFVTFDLAARPKPILVMELIKGMSAERLLRSRALDIPKAIELLDGMLAGLAAMHAAGVGHLDVKPSNVIVRETGTPVLVDFGLSGRQLRPGCGTLEYTAPEVLGVVHEGHIASPPAADLYAFASTAFELLTGQQLFQGADEMELMSQHLGHDGWPERLERLATRPEQADLAVVLAACLRHDPRERPRADETRPALAAAARRVAGSTWPLALAPAPGDPAALGRTA
ncbi:MAG: serine/threonine protein kinase [Polyangiaceae bacterium]|nr:serine/threonine protein kinase [Polyangiaceae bacterium]